MVLNGLLDQYNRSLSSLQQGLRDRQIQFNIDEMGIPGRLSVKDIRMQSLVQEQLELSMKSQSIKAQLDTMSAQNAQGQVPAVITQEVEKDPIIQNMQIQLTYLTMSTPDDGSAMNPISRSTQSKITNLRQALETTRAQKLSEAMVAAVQGLQSEKAQYDQNLKTISDEVNKMKDEMGQLNNAMAVYLTDKDEEKLLLEQRKEVEDALNIIRTTSTSKDVAGVTWALMPQTPEIPSFPTLWKTMVASVAIALLLSAAIAFLREVSDTTVRSPRDIHRIGSMNFLGMIPHEDDDPQATGSRLPLVIFDAPNSMMADQLRQVRTRLQYAASLDTTRSILVTSPGPNDGKTMLACNLAAGLALNGRRILVVDADFRRPALHKIFQVDNKYGFCEALQDVEKFEDCLHETEVPNLFVMPCGTKPGNSTELLESQLLVDFIERALEEFDHVIFDSGSIMVVSEAIALAPRVDGVVTVVRARSNSRGLLQRMRDTLRQLKAEHLGIILNAVRAQGGGYYGRNIKTYYAYQNET
jgi:capsular exopolysaccharide synthesis family protein